MFKVLKSNFIKEPNLKTKIDEPRADVVLSLNKNKEKNMDKKQRDLQIGGIKIPAKSEKEALDLLVGGEWWVGSTRRVYVTQDVYENFRPFDHLDLARTNACETRSDHEIDYIEIVRAGRQCKCDGDESGIVIVPCRWYLYYGSPSQDELKQIIWMLNDRCGSSFSNEEYLLGIRGRLFSPEQIDFVERSLDAMRYVHEQSNKEKHLQSKE